MGHEFKNGDKVKRLNHDDPWYYVGKHVMSSDTAAVIMQARSGSLTTEWLNHLSPYKEPLRVNGWVNIYERNASICTSNTFHYSHKDADLTASMIRNIRRIACVYVTGTEGENP